MFSVLLVTYILMMASGHINKLIGSSGASVVSRVMGLVLSSVAAANTLSGIRLYFNL
ncbi:MAG: MarC family protein [Porticoccaceae bacterium]